MPCVIVLDSACALVLAWSPPLAHMEQQNLTQLYSYDRGFDPITGIHRLEPELLEKGIEEKETVPRSEKA